MVWSSWGAAGVILAAALGVAAPASAGNDLDRISVGAGWFDVLDNQNSVDFRLEYRFGKTFLGFIKPWVGVEANTDGALYGAGGVLADIHLSDRIVITPSFGAGVYSDGGSKDLGHAIEFRSQIEIAYQFENSSRVSLGFSHTSNAHLDEDNPGSEVAMIYYHVPVSRLFGN
ncbi:MAG: acyloxyacyl hydrolase [Alphaproteobacteria bacterium]